MAISDTSARAGAAIHAEAKAAAASVAMKERQQTVLVIGSASGIAVKG
jgi:hypothetical protein